MGTKGARRGAAVLLGLEGGGLLGVVAWQIFALAAGDTGSMESAMALIILTGVGAPRSERSRSRCGATGPGAVPAGSWLRCSSSPWPSVLPPALTRIPSPPWCWLHRRSSPGASRPGVTPRAVSDPGDEASG